MTTSLALCCMSHSPLLNLPGPPPELLDDIDSAVAAAAEFVRAFDPELVVTFSPDHYNGFFYRLMPPFCIGTAAVGVGDYGTYAGPLNVPADVATACAEALWDAGVDIAVSASMDVDHGTVQPLQALFGDVADVPVLPVFVNSVATPLGPLRRTRALARPSATSRPPSEGGSSSWVRVGCRMIRRCRPWRPHRRRRWPASCTASR